MTKYLTILLSAALAMIFLACESTEKEAPAGPFPAPGAQLSEKQVQNLTFRWEEDMASSSRMTPVVNKILKLYRLIAVDEINGKTRYHFVLQSEQKIDQGNSFKLRNGQTLEAGQGYAWQVSGVDKSGKEIPIQNLSTFSIGDDLDGGMAFSLPTISSSTEMCKDTLYYGQNCDSFRIDEYSCDIPNIHIVNLENTDFLSDNFVMRSSQAHESEGCIYPGSDSLKVFTEFSVTVPCDKLDEVDTSEIKVFVFEQGIKLPMEELLLDVSVNDTASSSLAIAPENYLTYCDENGNSVCKAMVDVLVIFDLEYEGDTPLPYTFVFFLPTESNHLVIHQSQEFQPQQARMVSGLNVHDFSACPELENSDLAYYECLNSLTDEHIADHVVVVPCPFCEEGEEEGN